MHVECKRKSDTGNNWGNWNQLKIIHKVISGYVVNSTTVYV